MDAQDKKHALERLESATDEAKVLLDSGQLVEAERLMKHVAKENSQIFGSGDLKTILANHLYALILFLSGQIRESGEEATAPHDSSRGKMWERRE